MPFSGLLSNHLLESSLSSNLNTANNFAARSTHLAVWGGAQHNQAVN